MSGPTKVRPVSSDFWKVPLNNGLSRSDHIFHVRKCFAQKAGALKRMKYLPVKTLQTLRFWRLWDLFQDIISQCTLLYLFWGNCSTARLPSQTTRGDKYNWQPTKRERLPITDNKISTDNWHGPTKYTDGCIQKQEKILSWFDMCL